VSKALVSYSQHIKLAKKAVQQSSHQSLREWIRHMPYSKMVYPRSFVDRIKYLLWIIFTPLHPFARDLFLTLGIIQHNGRQPFLLGHVSPQVSIKEFIRQTIKHDYGNHFVAWHDNDELVSLRVTDGFKHQYHLRIFEDGEVHGHYEYTPEAHPFMHLNGVGFEDRRDFFLSQFGELLIPASVEEVEASTSRYYLHWHPVVRQYKRRTQGT